MQTLPAPISNERDYRNILGVKFFAGDARSAVERGRRGGLVVVPAAPALMELDRDGDYRQALLESDLALTDSGYMVLLWNLLMQDDVQRVSGLEYLTLLLRQPEFREAGNTLWVMPSSAALNRNMEWLRSKGYSADLKDFYVAPKYHAGSITDKDLLELIHARRPKHVIIGLGGGVQEKLGLYLKRHCVPVPSIHCIGAAIGFLTGDQVRIPMWADQWVLGWLFRCVSNPGRFVPRYTRAFKLAFVLWRYRADMPDWSS